MKVTMPLRATAAAAVLALGLAACGGGSSEDEPTSGSGEPTGSPGGSYVGEITEPSFLAPTSNCYESECSQVLDMINDPLVTTDFETGELIFDGLAESIEPNEDQTVWTVTLKEGRTFQNGEPVDSAAFERGLVLRGRPEERHGDRRLLSPRSTAPARASSSRASRPSTTRPSRSP